MSSAVDRSIRWALRVGLGATVALFAVGITLALVRGGYPSGVAMPGEIARGLVALDPRSFLSLGVMSLIGTQFLRVAAALVSFVRERDGRYVLVTAAVLLVMGASILLGRG